MATRKKEPDRDLTLIGFEPDEPEAKATPVVALDRPATPAVLLAMAVQQGADLDRLERLMALQERWEANEARKAMDEALSGFRGEDIDIVKRKKVRFTTDSGATINYAHAELVEICAAIGPALAKHGLTYRWNVTQGQGQITVECVVAHKAGHSFTVGMHAPPDTSGKKNAIQQMGSTVTYLQRYTLNSALGLSSRGDDDDGRGGKDVDESMNLQPGDESTIVEGQEQAEKGLKPLTEWWKGLSEAQRKRFTPHFADMRKVARDADKAKEAQ